MLLRANEARVLTAGNTIGHMVAYTNGKRRRGYPIRPHPFDAPLVILCVWIDG